MQIKIRRASATDAQDIAAFSRKSFYESFADQNTKENMEKFMLRFSMDVLAGEVSDPSNIFYLAMENDTIAGYIKLIEAKIPIPGNYQKAFEICRIYVDKSRIGQGIGNKLMKQGLEIAQELEGKIVWLGVWEHNVSALIFYKKWGFERFSKHTFMLGDDPQTDWLLKKELI